MNETLGLIGTRWYVNSFPKSGTHFAQSFLLPIAKPMPKTSLNKHPWAGTFGDNSFSRAWLDTRKVLYRLGSIKDGHYFKAHCGWKPEIEQFAWYMGICMLFIYRDFRDVAVSQAYHVTDEHEWSKHPDKEHYREIMRQAGMEGVLLAVIEGDEKFPGIMERWEDYAPWLNVKWVLPISFKDMKETPYEVAEIILKYGIMRVSAIWDMKVTFNAEVLEIIKSQMVEAAQTPDLSPSFRKGERGGWRDHFTPRVKAAFKDADKDNWLIQLGFEEDRAW